jgi:hypothetical protein
LAVLVIAGIVLVGLDDIVTALLSLIRKQPDTATAGSGSKALQEASSRKRLRNKS